MGLAYSVATLGRGFPIGWAFLIVVPLVVWPLVCNVILPGRPPGDPLPLAATVFPLTVLLFPPLLGAATHDAHWWKFATIGLLLLVPIAFHAAVRSRQPSGWVIGFAALLGVAWTLLRPGKDGYH
jgi:hypothetical protein